MTNFKYLCRCWSRVWIHGLPHTDWRMPSHALDNNCRRTVFSQAKTFALSCCMTIWLIQYTVHIRDGEKLDLGLAHSSACQDASRKTVVSIVWFTATDKLCLRQKSPHGLKSLSELLDPFLHQHPCLILNDAGDTLPPTLAVLQHLQPSWTWEQSVLLASCFAFLWNAGYNTMKG